MSESIVPSWQDVAERWKLAYDDENAKLARVRALCENAVQRSEDSPARTFYGEPFPAMVLAKDVLALLDGAL